MASVDFLAELRTLGFVLTEVDADKVTFPYEVPVGPRAGETIVLGFVVPGDYRASPPSGPHVSPPLYPLQSGGNHPTGGIHASPLGDAFQYWSRPFPGWAASGRTARDYMAFINGLFATL
jgi:hypothetical protein